MIDWTHWHNEPFLVGGLIFLGWLYAVLAGPMRGKLSAISGQQSAASSELTAPISLLPPFPARQAVLFYSSLLVFYLAVGSPLDQAGERYLLSAHMLQHQLMIYPAAVLFLLGLPEWMILPAIRQPALRPMLRFLTRPLVCGVIFVLVISCWHMPFLYETALQNRKLHIAEHFMFFGAALLYWWPILSPSKDFPPTSFAWQMLYLLAVEIGMTPLFAYITFSHDILYATYEYAPRISPLDPADDQLLAGSMMKLIGFSVALCTFGVCFYRWHRATERATGKVKV
ncbi:MAG TPA: cytochrome c oxidase assembly protein [Candidatus Didemnitutus sp.]|nr:cytochrome c oxidase assembly protein [Candidatus Didemnitutus sp.]